MNSHKMISIMCSLQHSYDEFKTVNSSFLYEFAGEKYTVDLIRENGKLIEFSVVNLDVSNENS